MKRTLSVWVVNDPRHVYTLATSRQDIPVTWLLEQWSYAGFSKPKEGTERKYGECDLVCRDKNIFDYWQDNIDAFDYLLKNVDEFAESRGVNGNDAFFDYVLERFSQFNGETPDDWLEDFKNFVISLFKGELDEEIEERL